MTWEYFAKDSTSHFEELRKLVTTLFSTHPIRHGTEKLNQSSAALLQITLEGTLASLMIPLNQPSRAPARREKLDYTDTTGNGLQGTETVFLGTNSPWHQQQEGQGARNFGAVHSSIISSISFDFLGYFLLGSG